MNELKAMTAEELLKMENDNSGKKADPALIDELCTDGKESAEK